MDIAENQTPTAEKPYYKVELISVKMQELGEYKTFRRQIGVKKVQKAKGLFTKETVEVDQPVYETVREWQSSGRKSIGDIDMNALQEQLQDACNILHQDGYDILSITPVIKGAHDYFVQPGLIQKGTGTTSIAYAYGHGVTDGLLITARLRTS